MKRLFCFLIIAFLFSSSLHAQSDSVPALFKCSLKNYKLQWETGFVAVAFKNALLTGVSTDFIGIQYKKIMHVSIGAEEATNNIYLNPGYTDPKIYTAQNAHMAYYLNVEPIIFPNHLFNLTIPVKLCYTDNVAGHDSKFTENFIIAPGVNVSVNLLQNISLGTGFNYRFNAINIFTSSAVPSLSGDAYTLWLFLRIGLK